CSMELLKAGKKSTTIEKEDCVGGLAKTFVFKEGKNVFRTDIGPHRFFSKNPYLYSFIEELLHEKWLEVPRLTRQYIDGKFYDYPINASQAFKNLGILKSMNIGLDYIFAFIDYKILGKKIVSFEDYVIANFGRSLSEMNMINYTEKIWGMPCKYIHPDWAKQRIKGLNLISATKSVIFKKKGKNNIKTLVDQFYYPQYGTGLIYDTIAKKLGEGGSKVITKSFPKKIKHKNSKIVEVELNFKGKKKTINPKFLVESVPITEFLGFLFPKPPKIVLQAAKNLKWRSQVYLFLTIDKQSVMKDNWVYFPDKHIPFGRIAEMKNFSKDMAPQDKTSLFVEYFVFENDKTWNMSKEEVFEMTIKELEKLGFVKRTEVRKYYLIKRKNVYPVYDLKYQGYLETIKSYLDSFENLFYVGRPGRFKYNNQDHSLEMGILAARSILEGKKYDFEKSGSEAEYFEKGQIKVGEDSVEKKAYNWMVLEDRGDYNGSRGSGK
ncbi:MAG: FAD-dependent oxidoreductase, partial [Nanoarchaeota archaeon]|nr:FAD-dependent oxidoreductase [Nanoarchaeota archaeon]